jgi:hypothetical protein
LLWGQLRERWFFVWPPPFRCVLSLIACPHYFAHLGTDPRTSVTEPAKPDTICSDSVKQSKRVAFACDCLRSDSGCASARLSLYRSQ